MTSDWRKAEADLVFLGGGVAVAFQRLDIGLRLAAIGTGLEMLNNEGILRIRLSNELYLPAVGNWSAGE